MNSKRTEVGPTLGLFLLITFVLNERMGGDDALQQPHSPGGNGNDGISMCRILLVRVLRSCSGMFGLRVSREDALAPKSDRRPLHIRVGESIGTSCMLYCLFSLLPAQHATSNEQRAVAHQHMMCWRQLLAAAGRRDAVISRDAVMPPPGYSYCIHSHSNFMLARHFASTGTADSGSRGQEAPRGPRRKEDNKSTQIGIPTTNYLRTS